MTSTWTGSLTNECLALAFRSMRSSSAQSELERIRDQKQIWADNYAPPGRVLNDKATQHLLEHIGPQNSGKIGDYWPVYHFHPLPREQSGDRDSSKPVIVYFHSDGFYGQVSIGTRTFPSRRRGRVDLHRSRH